MAEDKILREQVEETIFEKLDLLSTLEPGSDKHSKLCEDICKLYKACTEDYKVECEVFNQNQRIENDKKKDNLELKLKELQINRESRRFMQIKADTLLTCATIVGLTIGTCTFESRGYIFPGKLLQHVPRLRLPL